MDLAPNMTAVIGVSPAIMNNNNNMCNNNHLAYVGDATMIIDLLFAYGNKTYVADVATSRMPTTAPLSRMRGRTFNDTCSSINSR